MATSIFSICSETLLMKPIFAHSTLHHGQVIVILAIAATVSKVKIVTVTLLISDIDIVLIGIKMATIFGAGIATIATKAALCIKLDDVFNMIGMTGIAAAAAEARAVSVGLRGAFRASVEILANVAQLVGARTNRLFALTRLATFGAPHSAGLLKVAAG